MSLYIQTQGQGPIPLVMLHGWAMHGGIFSPLVEVLSERCTMYLIDLPGHGFSRDCTLPLTPRACAHAIAKATPPAIWLGWSLGGLVALEGALHFPQQVRGLAMLCATPRFVSADDWPQGCNPALLHQLAIDLKADYHATIERFLALEVMGGPDPRAGLRKLRADVFARGEPDLCALQEGLGVLKESDLRASLPRLKAGYSWWSAGRLDRLVPPCAMEWSAQASHGQFQVLDHAGHAPFLSHAEPLAISFMPWLEATHERL